MSAIQKIIAYYGAKNSGKTTTLNNLINFINAHPSFETLLLNPSLLEQEGIQDQYAVFKHIETNKRIAVATAGDDAETVNNHLKALKKDQINIAVLATRYHGETVHALPKFIEENLIDKLWWIGASYPTSHDIPDFSIDENQIADYNQVMATTLFNAIEIELQKK